MISLVPSKHRAMCSGVYQYWAVTLHHYSVGLVAKDISKNQEVELLLFLFFGDLESSYSPQKSGKKQIPDLKTCCFYNLICVYVSESENQVPGKQS